MKHLIGLKDVDWFAIPLVKNIFMVNIVVGGSGTKNQKLLKNVLIFEELINNYLIFKSSLQISLCINLLQ